MWPLVSGYLGVAFKNFFLFLSFLRKTYLGVCATQYMCRGQRPTCKRQFSPTAMWVLRIKTGSSGWTASAFTCNFTMKSLTTSFLIQQEVRFLRTDSLSPYPMSPRLYLAFTKLVPGFPVCFCCSIGSQNILPRYSKCSHSNTDVKKIL